MKRISAVMILLLFLVVVVAAPVAAAESYIFEPFEIGLFADFYPNSQNYSFLYDGYLPEGDYTGTIHWLYNGLQVECFDIFSILYDEEYWGYPASLHHVDLYAGGAFFSDATIIFISVEESTVLGIYFGDGSSSDVIWFPDGYISLDPIPSEPEPLPFAALFRMTYNVMQTPMTIYDFTFSWWDVFMWSALAGVAAFFLGRYFNA